MEMKENIYMQSCSSHFLEGLFKQFGTSLIIRLLSAYFYTLLEMALEMKTHLYEVKKRST